MNPSVSTREYGAFQHTSLGLASSHGQFQEHECGVLFISILIGIKSYRPGKHVMKFGEPKDAIPHTFIHFLGFI